MNGKMDVGIVLLVLGIVLLILSLSADLLGVGTYSGLGYVQIIGIVLGIFAGICGFLMLKK